MINEAEPAVHLAVKAHAPNLVQFEGWIHRFRDMERYMRQKGYGAHAIGYFKVRVLYFVILYIPFAYHAFSVWSVPRFLGILLFLRGLYLAF